MGIIKGIAGIWVKMPVEMTYFGNVTKGKREELFGCVVVTFDVLTTLTQQSLLLDLIPGTTSQTVEPCNARLTGVSHL